MCGRPGYGGAYWEDEYSKAEAGRYPEGYEWYLEWRHVAPGLAEAGVEWAGRHVLVLGCGNSMLVHAGDGPIGRGDDERACEVRGCDGRGRERAIFRERYRRGAEHGILEREFLF